MIVISTTREPISYNHKLAIPTSSGLKIAKIYVGLTRNEVFNHLWKDK